jgi:rhodanese-related sulfurtransferase
MSFPELTPLEAHARLGVYRMVDVREEREFHGPLGFVEDAELIPLSTVEANADRLVGSAPLLLICRSGKRSGMACEKLQELGSTDVTNLVGGMIAWNRALLPVRHTEPRTLTDLVDQIASWAAQVGPLTTDAALDIVRDRFERQGVCYEAPTHAAVEEFISFVALSLEAANPPDLDLGLASFRRSLAVL